MTDSIAGSAPASAADDAYNRLLAGVRRRLDTFVDGRRDHLFTTAATGLFAVFLDALPAEMRQEYTCSACRKFVERYGAVVKISDDGAAKSVLWDPEQAPEPFTAAVRALATAVARAPVDGVFLSSEREWGTARTGAWEHLAATPPKRAVFRPTALQTAGQAAAERRHDFEVLQRGLAEFPAELVQRAHTLLTTDQLFRSEKCIGVAKWLHEVHTSRARARDELRRDNLTWLAVADAPAGFCHVRSTMIGTLLEDLAAGLPFAEIKARFDAKMNPLQYQRPTAPPSAGNVAQAEKIVAQLRSAGALERRFARLADIRALWRPPTPKGADRPGVFSHLLPPAGGKPTAVDAPPVTMTWEKFARTVLPTAEAIEYFVPTSDQFYMALVTAKDPDAPPILQWDREDERNPVSWYTYVKGSSAAHWNLRPGVWHPVTAVALQPSMWSEKQKYPHQGEKVLFLLEGAKDREYAGGAGFFPEFLRSEYHPIRATLEAYAQKAKLADADQAEACGIGLQKGTGWDQRFRVTAGGMQLVYKLDRWD